MSLGTLRALPHLACLICFCLFCLLQIDELVSQLGGYTWLLCPDTDEGARDVMHFNDLAETGEGRLHKKTSQKGIAGFSKGHCVLAQIHGAVGDGIVSLAVAIEEGTMKAVCQLEPTRPAPRLVP